MDSAGFVGFPLFLCWISYHFLFRCKKPTLHFQQSEWNDKMIKTLDILHNTYYPPLYASSAHVQLILGQFLNRFHKQVYKREILTLKDGGHIALDFVDDTNALLADETPIVIVMHGLAGGSEDYGELTK